MVAYGLLEVGEHLAPECVELAGLLKRLGEGGGGRKTMLG